MALVVDTGPLVAALDRADDHHKVCRELLEQAGERRVIPAPVLPEVDYFCGRYGGRSSFVELLEDVRRGAFAVEDLAPADYDRAGELMAEYGDLDVGFVDAAVLAIVERLGEPKLATLDRRHFGVLRPRHVGALRLLP